MPDGANIKPLTSLRFFAAFWVVLYDYWPNLATHSTPVFVTRGYLGVELFFTLSGFILCHVYLPSVEAGRFRYGDFLWARLARLYPLHLVTLVGIGLLAGAALLAGRSVDPNVVSLAALPANLTLTQAWGLAPVAGWNHPSWSISYLTFPAFAFAALSLRRRPYLAVILALALLAGLYAGFESLAGAPLTQATIAWGALRIVPCFAYGCAAFILWRRRAADGRRTAALGALFFGAGVLAAAQFGAPDALIVAAFGGLIFCLAQLARSGSAWGTHRVFEYLGEISYSTYMICVPWQLLFVNLAARYLNLGVKQLPFYAWLVLVLAIFPLSAISYHLIERPTRRRMKLWWSHNGGHEFATAEVR
ncbi:MAG: acyltransferase family protein [Caulobacterales bacterium]